LRLSPGNKRKELRSSASGVNQERPAPAGFPSPCFSWQEVTRFITTGGIDLQSST
jgi:hypothetical protein